METSSAGSFALNITKQSTIWASIPGQRLLIHVICWHYNSVGGGFVKTQRHMTANWLLQSVQNLGGQTRLALTWLLSILKQQWLTLQFGYQILENLLINFTHRSGLYSLCSKLGFNYESNNVCQENEVEDKVHASEGEVKGRMTLNENTLHHYKQFAPPDKFVRKERRCCIVGNVD